MISVIIIIFVYYRNLKRLCSNLEAHFIIDPLLLPAFLHMMPYPSYEMLFEVLPLFYCVARLGYFCDSPQATSVRIYTTIFMYITITFLLLCYFRLNTCTLFWVLFILGLMKLLIIGK